MFVALCAFVVCAPSVVINIFCLVIGHLQFASTSLLRVIPFYGSSLSSLSFETRLPTDPKAIVCYFLFFLSFLLFAHFHFSVFSSFFICSLLILLFVLASIVLYCYCRSRCQNPLLLFIHMFAPASYSESLGSFVFLMFGMQSPVEGTWVGSRGAAWVISCE